MLRRVTLTMAPACLLFLWAGCGAGSDEAPPKVDREVVASDAGPPPPDAGEEPPVIQPVVQVAMGNPLPYGQFVADWTTFRIPIHLMRTGSQVQVAFFGTKGAMSLRAVHFGLVTGPGAVSENAPLTFSGSNSVEVGQGELVVSDRLDYPVDEGGQYAVSFVARGDVAGSLEEVDNQGVSVPGEHSGEALLSGTPEPAVRGVRWVSVLGAPQRVTAVLGDSIGAGSAVELLEDRFVERAQRELGEPVIDSSVGGDGTWRAMERLAQDVIALPGVTDCLVQVGTNDLGAADAPLLIERLTRMYQQLSDAGIRPWGGTLLPKGEGVLSADAERVREQVNEFIRTTPLLFGVVDFAAAVADPANASLPVRGALARDGIHPTMLGHHLMAEELVEALRRAVPVTE